ncbi:PAS domain-containing protein [Brasilonema sp. CT11]|nr:PAS domain-containing protein [Brasilonema sp. CT11]
MGYHRNEIINQHISILYGDKTESSPKEKIAKGLNSHKEKSTSLMLYRKDNVPLEVFVRLSPLKKGTSSQDLGGIDRVTIFTFLSNSSKVDMMILKY